MASRGDPGAATGGADARSPPYPASAGRARWSSGRAGDLPRPRTGLTLPVTTLSVGEANYLLGKLTPPRSCAPKSSPARPTPGRRSRTPVAPGKRSVACRWSIKRRAGRDSDPRRFAGFFPGHHRLPDAGYRPYRRASARHHRSTGSAVGRDQRRRRLHRHRSLAPCTPIKPDCAWRWCATAPPTRAP
jgi:hypothetical protein